MRTRWVDAHCHLQLEIGETRFSPDDADAQVHARARRRRRVDGVRRHRPRDVAAGGRPRRRSTTTCTRRSACIRTTRRSSTPSGTGSTALAGAERVRRDRRGRLRPPLRALAARRAGGRVPPPDPARARRVDRPLVIHSRDAWDDTFRVLDDEGVPDAHDLPLLHRRSRRSAARARPRLLPVVQRHRVVQDRRRRARRGRARARRPRARRDRRAVPRAGAAPRQAERARVRVARRRRARARRAASTSTRSPSSRARTRRGCSASSGDADRDPGAARRARPAPEQGARPELPRRPQQAAHIVRLAGVQPGDHVVEVGPGLGSLTLALCDAGAHVRAVELDRRSRRRARDGRRRHGRSRSCRPTRSTVDWAQLLARPRPLDRWCRTCRTTSRRRSSCARSRPRR